jgi:3-oxoacyl-[acyl-carrier-protein] synthase-1
VAAADPAFRSLVAVGVERREVRTVVSNSFGFGGVNCSLIFGAAG